MGKSSVSRADVVAARLHAASRFGGAGNIVGCNTGSDLYRGLFSEPLASSQPMLARIKPGPGRISCCGLGASPPDTHSVIARVGKLSAEWRNFGAGILSRSDEAVDRRHGCTVLHIESVGTARAARIGTGLPWLLIHRTEALPPDQATNGATALGGVPLHSSARWWTMSAGGSDAGDPIRERTLS